MSSSRTAARAGVLLGALGALAVPLSVVAAQASKSLTLLRGLYYAAPTALVLGALALLAARRARLSSLRSVFSNRGGPIRTARVLGWLAIWAGVTTAIAIGVYWTLRARH
jgi:hypothetical protein